jgi:hypothetical protein
MELTDRIKTLAARVERQRESVLTEEACKNAFVMPFLNTLGYDVFNPDIVVPEFIADVGVKKGEKVDYAIKINGKISILVECKGCGANLGQAHMSQLFRYFTVTEARFAILTNGIDFWFYTDLDEPNKMDQRPFFQFNVLDFRPHQIAELNKFTAQAFNVEDILSTASNLKYSNAIKAALLKEIESPSEEMIRLLVTRVFTGRFTQKVREDFAPIVSAAFRDSIRDAVSDRLTTALEVTTGTPGVVGRVSSGVGDAPAEPPEPRSGEIATTDDEIEGYHIVKAIVRSVVKADRVVMRDAKSYCAILLDDNNRKPITRLHFNSTTTRYLSLFTGKDEERMKIDSIDDIYDYADRLRETVKSYT